MSQAVTPSVLRHLSNSCN